MGFDGAVFGREIVATVKDHVAAVVAPLLARIDELEKRLPQKGDKGDRGEDGKSVTVEDVLPLIESGIVKAVATIVIPKGDKGDPGDRGEDGKSVTVEDVLPLIESGIVKAVATIVIPKGDKGDPGDRGEDGKSITVDDVLPLINDQITKTVAGLVLPKGDKGDPGSPGGPGPAGADAPAPTVEQVAKSVFDYLQANPPAAGKDGADGKDGVGLAGALIDRDGVLHLTMTDGETRVLGVIVGRDGTNGKDGERGTPGRDGFSLDDFEFEQKQNGRTIIARFKRGDDVQEKEFKFNCVLDRGVWKAGNYECGDGVTWGGSFWIAQCDTDSKPETSPDWRLAVKRGRDGKDGKDGKPGDRGLQGLPGRDYEGNRR